MKEKTLKENLCKVYAGHKWEKQMERELKKEDKELTDFYILEGTPPKAYATYMPELQALVLTDGKGRPVYRLIGVEEIVKEPKEEEDTNE